jgi:hypothetical protein
VKDVFAKKFFGVGRDSLAALVPLNVTAPKPWLMMVAEPALITMSAPLKRTGITTRVKAPGRKHRPREKPPSPHFTLAQRHICREILVAVVG